MSIQNLNAKIHTGMRFLFLKIEGTQPLALCVPAGLSSLGYGNGNSKGNEK